MNPAGIPIVFTERSNATTAIQEVRSDPAAAASIGQFELLHEFRVVDLTALPPFVESSPMARVGKKRLSASCMSCRRPPRSPIEARRSGHIEYVLRKSSPSTSGIDSYMNTRPGKKSQVYGILYPSSKAEDGINAVVFFDRFSCEGIEE